MLTKQKLPDLPFAKVNSPISDITMHLHCCKQEALINILVHHVHRAQSHVTEDDVTFLLCHPLQQEKAVNVADAVGIEDDKHTATSCA